MAGRQKMRLGWLSFHREGLEALTALLETAHHVHCVMTLRRDLLAERSGSVDYRPLCERFGVPLYEIDNINKAESQALLKEQNLDVLFVIGWSQILSDQTLRLARRGMIGAHASMLPKYPGSAPVNWAIIKGDTRTGNTLIWLEPGVDSGAIIDQTEFPITPFDTCATLYDKVAASNRDMILRAVERLEKGEYPGEIQRGGHPLLPKRRPEDGQIDWVVPARSVYDFVRALTRPYPGAFSFLGGDKYLIWSCSVLPGNAVVRTRPGIVLGPAFSPEPGACGQMIACGEGAVVVLEVEAGDGTILSGPELAMEDWRGRRWTDDGR